jgi:leader peptidase (prepilin peptidase)/N-methyltransferase
MPDLPLPFGPAHPLFGVMLGFVIAIGACIGSFLNVVIWRLPRGESIVTGPSHCPHCQYHIPFYLNVPVLAWLWLRGRCAHCRAPISPRYPVVEALTAVLFAWVWVDGWQAGQPLALIVSWLVLTTLLLAITYIDYDHRIIPHELVITGLVLAVVGAVVWPATHEVAVAPGTLDELRHKPILYYLAGLLGGFWPGLLTSARLLAVLDLLAGLLLGGGFLWLVVEIGKLCCGRRRMHRDEPLEMTLTAQGFSVPDDQPQTWEELFMRERDCLEVRGRLLAVTGEGAAALLPYVEQELVLSVREAGLHLVPAGEVAAGAPSPLPLEVPLAALPELRVRTAEWIEPREVMGLGDVNLLAMIGAFLGPGGALFTLILSSFLGSVGGLLWIRFGRGRFTSPIPYGPYIAGAALLYLLYAEEIIRAYLYFVQTLIFLLEQWFGGASA